MDDRRNSIGQQDDDQVRALAAAIYGEARNQGTIGKTAVAYTALTRAQMADVPVADVVYGSSSPKYGQYSFANPQDPNAKTVANAPKKDPQGWADAVNVAKGVISGELENPMPGATNYKTKAVNPSWADVYDKVGTLGAHEFYVGPPSEIRSVVQKSARSPNRRADLTPGADVSGTIGGSFGLEPGTFEDMTDVDGNPTTVSLGEFDFSGPRSERGFSNMNPETQHVAGEMARTLPDDQRMTMTATHGEHGLSNLTHTPGAAFDVRTRDLTEAQQNAMIDSALYSRPAAIGYNSGFGKFAPHMHVDTNAGYGTGLQSTSDLTGLSDYAKQELARYDEEMKSGLGYTPPVPESIAPVPEARPISVDPSIAQAAIDGSPYRADPQSGLSGGLSAMVDANNPNMSSDGVPISRVQSLSIRPGDTISAPEEPSSSIASALSSLSPIGTAYAGTPADAASNVSLGNNPYTSEASTGVTPGASAKTSVSLPESVNVSATGSSYAPQPEAYTSVPLGATSVGALAQDLPTFADKPPEVEKTPLTATSIGAATMTPGATATAKIALGAPTLPEPEITPEVVTTLPEVKPQPVVRRPAPVPETSRFPSAPSKPERDPVARASDVWSGKAAEGIATDGSKLSRNPDGSISRYSDLSGKTEKVSGSISGWGGPSIGDTSQKTGGFWSSAAEGTLGQTGEGGTSGTKSLGQSLSDFFGGGGKGAPTTQQAQPQTQGGTGLGGSSNGRGGIGGFFSSLFGGLGFGGTNTGGGRSQYETAKDPTSVGLY